MKQVTMVSFYGEKPKQFKELVNALWGIVDESELRRFFQPYDMRQIHGTIVGMEKVPGYQKPYNLNHQQSSGRLIEMNFADLRRTVCASGNFGVQFGGFSEERQEFASFGKKPYFRGFQVQWATRKVTMIGWPFMQSGDRRTFSERPLFSLRTSLGQLCDIEHKYAPPKHEDNDLFMVIGELINLHDLDKAELQAMKSVVGRDLEPQARNHLKDHSCDLHLTKEQIFIARYVKETLPLDSTDVFCLADTIVDAELVMSLY